MWHARTPYEKKRSGKTVQLNVSIPEDLKPILVKAAEKEGRSLSNLVSWLLQRAMKELAWRMKK